MGCEQCSFLLGALCSCLSALEAPFLALIYLYQLYSCDLSSMSVPTLSLSLCSSLTWKDLLFLQDKRS